MLWMLPVLCGSLSVSVGILLGQSSKVFEGFSNNRRAAKALKHSGFASLASSVDGGEFVATVNQKNKKSVETIEMIENKVPVISSLEIYTSAMESKLPNGLKKKALSICQALGENQDDEMMSLEEKHNLAIISEQLFSSIRLFNALSSAQQGSRSVAKELTEQFAVLLSAVEEITDSHSDSVIGQLKVNTMFVKSKFQKTNPLTLR